MPVGGIKPNGPDRARAGWRPVVHEPRPVMPPRVITATDTPPAGPASNPPRTCRAPEAYDAEGDFRASLYVRPLAIWAIEEALERRAKAANAAATTGPGSV